MSRTIPVLIPLIFLLAAADAAKNVTIAKCCSLDEVLTGDNKCVRTINPEWKLKVYSAAKKSYLPANRVPDNWSLRPAAKPPCQTPGILAASMPSYIPFQNGSVYIVEYNKLVHPQSFCIDYQAILICREELEKAPSEVFAPVRIKKCCGPNAIFSVTNQSCIRMEATYKIDLGANKTLGQGFPNCESHEVVFNGKLQESEMYDNGSIWMAKSKILVPVGNYCLEHVFEDASGGPSIMMCQEHFLPGVIAEPTQNHDLRFTIYPIGLALSAVFLAATLATSAILPASHHVLHSRCQINHVACLLVGDVLLCITHLSGKMDPTFCFIVAVLMHFLFLAAFFWLNTMCFNIWWTFRDLRPQSMERSQERCRLRLYELYAWGVPLIIAGTAACLDSVADGADFLRPKFGKDKCWFYGTMEILTFFYGPIGILLMTNLALFALTARELTCGLWKRELVKSTSERAALGRVCMKLVVVMGVSWIADVLSWIVGGPQELWYLTDLINCLQGVFIFIVIGCQPQVLSAVKRLWCFRKQWANGTTGTRNHHSSSSQGLPSMGDTVTNHSVTNNTTKSVPLETSC